MNDVNVWLVALSFLLGLVLTFTLMIRRVEREAPDSAAGAVPAAGAAGFAGGRSGAESEPKLPPTQQDDE